MTKKDEDDKDYKPVSSKMSYGWGWVFLAGLFVLVMNKSRNGISEQTGNYIKRIHWGLPLTLDKYQ
jgi:hypothetical protein